MRRLTILSSIILLVLLSSVSVIGCQQQAPTPAPVPTPGVGIEHQVTITNSGFEPPEINIKAKDTVTWTNLDTKNHTVAGGIFDSGDLEPGETYSKTFTKTGILNYLCNFHPDEKGKIIITK